jgi:hypothetical protein
VCHVFALGMEGDGKLKIAIARLADFDVLIHYNDAALKCRRLRSLSFDDYPKINQFETTGIFIILVV